MPRLGVDQAAEILEKLEGHPLMVTPDLCTRQRHRRSTCRRCFEACPVGAIQWDEGLVVDWEVCTGCGICAALCPTGALEARGPSRDELLVQIQRVAREQERVSFACPRALDAVEGKPQCLAVSCLGRLDEALLVGAVAHGAQPVWLVDGACEGCPQAAGRAVAGAVASRSNALLGAFGIHEAISFRPDVPGVQAPGGDARAPEEGVSRRGMFKALARETARVGEITAETVQRGEKEQEPEEKPRGELPRAIPPGRLLLLAALKRLGSPVDPLLQGDEEGLFARFSLGEECTTCQMCAFFCPTGALTKVEDGDRVGLAFRVASCTNCSLCRDICYKDAVVLGYQVDLSRVLDLSVEWLFVQEQEEPPWKKPPDERLGRQILDLLGR